MGSEYEYIEGKSLPDEDEQEGSINRTLFIRGEPDEIEQKNIESAVAWTLRRNFKPEKSYLRSLYWKCTGK